MKKVGTPKGRPTVVRGKTVKVRPSGGCSKCSQHQLTAHDSMLKLIIEASNL